MKLSKSVKVISYSGVVVLVFGIIYLLASSMGYVDAFKLGLKFQQQQAQQNQDKIVLDALGKIILLPENVSPTMAVINDIDSLKANQPAFFSNAKNGDRVILYPDMAIVFDYQANKIIHVGPVQTVQQDPNLEGTNETATSKPNTK